MARDARSDSRETVVSASGSEDENDPLVCPLTGDLFECPVLLLQSGETYVSPRGYISAGRDRSVETAARRRRRETGACLRYEAGALALALAKEPGVDPWTRLPRAAGAPEPSALARAAPR